MKAFVAKWRARCRVAVTDGGACPICLADIAQDARYVTPCQHAFCTPCVEVLATAHRVPYEVPCPLCRAPFHYTKPFDPTLYPSKANFAFISDRHERHMLHSAYQTITREKGWAYLHQYRDTLGYGIIFTDDKVIQGLMCKIEDDYRGHSGGSIGFTMRRMHRVAQVGYAAYVTQFKSARFEPHDVSGVVLYRVT